MGLLFGGIANPFFSFLAELQTRWESFLWAYIPMMYFASLGAVLARLGFRASWLHLGLVLGHVLPLAWAPADPLLLITASMCSISASFVWIGVISEKVISAMFANFTLIESSNSDDSQTKKD